MLYPIHYLPFRIGDTQSENAALSRLSSCISEIKSWMTANMLKLNEGKTKFFIAVPEHLRNKVPAVSLQAGNKIIQPSNTVSNLEVEFDVSLSMDCHIATLCSSLTNRLRNITRIRRFLDFNTCHLIIRALVLSRLDYSNGLFLGSNASDVLRLQRIQNWAAKLICGMTKFQHATPCLQRLHWLPVAKRIKFKILVTVFKCLHKKAPQYISSCLTLYRPHRGGLRSASDTTRLDVPSTAKTLKTTQNRTFSYASPRMWNDLPVFAELRHFDSVQENIEITFVFNIGSICNMFHSVSDHGLSFQRFDLHEKALYKCIIIIIIISPLILTKRAALNSLFDE